MPKQKITNSPAHGWWREATVFALVLVVVGIISHKKILNGIKERFPQLMGEDQGVDYESESFFGSGGMQIKPRRIRKLEPEKYPEIFQEIANLDSRSTAEVVLGRCHFQIPDLHADEVGNEEGAQVFREYRGVDGVIVQIMVAAFPRGGVQLGQAEEISKNETFVLVKQVVDEGPATFYQIPKIAEEPVCGIKVVMPQLDFTNADTAEIRAALNHFAKKLANTAQLK